MSKKMSNDLLNYWASAQQQSMMNQLGAMAVWKIDTTDEISVSPICDNQSKTEPSNRLLLLEDVK